MVFKPLDELRKEGEQGTRKINQYTRYGTIVLSLVPELRHRDEPRGAEQRRPRRRRARATSSTHAGLGLPPHDDASR